MPLCSLDMSNQEIENALTTEAGKPCFKQFPWAVVDIK